MKIVLVVKYVFLALFALFCGWIYPDIINWSYLVCGVCGLHLGLGLIVGIFSPADAAKIAVWFWHGISVLLTSGFLLVYVLRQERGWLLLAIASSLFTVFVTLSISLFLKKENILKIR